MATDKLTKFTAETIVALEVAHDEEIFGEADTVVMRDPNTGNLYSVARHAFAKRQLAKSSLKHAPAAAE